MSTTCGAAELPLTLPVAQRVRSGFLAGRISRCAEGRLPSVLVKARRSFGPKRLPSMNAPERRPLARLPRDPIFLSFRSGARHRSRSFAATIRLPTFLRSAMRSRAAELDSFSCPLAHRLRPRMRPTSFIDFCNRIVPRARPRFVRAPLHRAYGRPSRSFFRTSPDVLTSCALPERGWLRVLSGGALSRLVVRARLCSNHH